MTKGHPHGERPVPPPRTADARRVVLKIQEEGVPKVAIDAWDDLVAYREAPHTVGREAAEFVANYLLPTSSGSLKFDFHMLGARVLSALLYDDDTPRPRLFLVSLQLAATKKTLSWRRLSEELRNLATVEVFIEQLMHMGARLYEVDSDFSEPAKVKGVQMVERPLQPLHEQPTYVEPRPASQPPPPRVATGSLSQQINEGDRRFRESIARKEAALSRQMSGSAIKPQTRHAPPSQHDQGPHASDFDQAMAEGQRPGLSTSEAIRLN